MCPLQWPWFDSVLLICLYIMSTHISTFWTHCELKRFESLKGSLGVSAGDAHPAAVLLSPCVSMWTQDSGLS